MRSDLTVLKNILTSDGIDALEWQTWLQPGRAGADIHRLYDIPGDASTEEAFIVRFAPGAHGDQHQHRGFELMFVLTGDLIVGNDGTYGPGDLLIEQPDSVHQVSSINGAVVLCIRHGEAVGLAPQEIAS